MVKPRLRRRVRTPVAYKTPSGSGLTWCWPSGRFGGRDHGDGRRGLLGRRLVRAVAVPVAVARARQGELAVVTGLGLLDLVAALLTQALEAAGQDLADQ